MTFGDKNHASGCQRVPGGGNEELFSRYRISVLQGEGVLKMDGGGLHNRDAHNDAEPHNRRWLG